MKPAALTLCAFDIFSELDGDQRASVAARMSGKHYGAGASVLPSLDDDNSVYFLVSGQVRACAYNQAGRQVYFEDLLPGAMFGELAAIDDGERSNDCICTVPSLILILHQAAFRAVLDEFPSVKDRVMLRLVSMVRRQVKRVYEYSSYTVSQRIRFELLRLESSPPDARGCLDLTEVPTQAELADRVSSHREAVSRELKFLESEGLITWQRKAHRIHDPERLLLMATGRV